MITMFYFEYRIGANTYEIEAEVSEKSPDYYNTVSDWDNQGWVDILGVWVYDKYTGEDVSDEVDVSDTLVRREWEIYKDMKAVEGVWD